MKVTISLPDRLKGSAPVPEGKVWLLPPTGNLYKMNLHTHSTVSDGAFTPAQLKAFYMAQGYSAVAFSDHRICQPHTELTDENFVALTCIEVDFNRYDETGLVRKVVHMNALCRDPEAAFAIPAVKTMEFDEMNAMIRHLKDRNCYVTVNHPVWSDMSTDDLLRLHGMDAVEIFNSIGVEFNNYSDDSAFFEYFLRAGGKAIPIAADDCHRSFADGTPFVEYFQGFTVAKADTLTYDSLVNALDTGAIYASSGPMFRNLWLEGDELHVETAEPVSGVFVHGKYLHYKVAELERTDSITHSVLDIGPLRAISPYIWVQLKDTKGKKAWSVPYWF